MKKIATITSTILACAVAPQFAAAELLNINIGNITYAVPSAQAGEMLYTNGSILSILGKDYSLSELETMTVTDGEFEDNTVSVDYNGGSAHVTVHGAIARFLSVSVDGAHVSVVQSDEVSDTTCGEITYILSGTSTDGSFAMTGSYKATLSLNGLSLTNPSGAPLDIQDGKRIKLSVESGTDNSLVDGAGGSQKGAIVCKGHLEIKGKGTLNVEGNTSHAIYAKEYIEMKNATVNVTKALKDGVNCNQYFLMESGNLNISGTADDGVQVSFKDDTDREPEDTGTLFINGGAVNVAVTGTAVKALKADGNVSISGGEITASASGGGMWNSTKSKTKASACIGADGYMEVTGGKLILSASGGGGKGVSVDGDLMIKGGEFDVTTTGGIYAYINGTEYQNYTGNTDNLDSDLKSSPKGMKADGNIVIDGGDIKVTTTGNGAEGIESKSELTINDGTIYVKAYDDAINSSSHMHINGGDIIVIATNNDGLDSNGNMYFNGGTVRAFGASAPECGIDADEESGYSVVFTGGKLLAVGGNNSTPSTSESTQPYVTSSSSLKAGDEVTLKSGNDVLVTFTVPEGYSGNGGSSGGGRPGWGGGGPGGSSGGGTLISCPGLVSGSSYTLTVGSSTSTVTAQLKGSSSGRPF